MMQANWSIILNILLLIGVIAAIGRLMKAKKQNLSSERAAPSLGLVEKNPYEIHSLSDDIIAVRKVNRDPLDPIEDRLKFPSKPVPVVYKPTKTPLEARRILEEAAQKTMQEQVQAQADSVVMMFLLAKDQRQFAGYELLQTLLATGLRFGEGNLFHRHQFPNGQGSILCSIAAATSTGIFDLQNIGAFSVRGLCLFMHPTRDASMNEERFLMMLETGRQLSEGLDASLLDANRKPLTSERLASYYQLLGIEEDCAVY